MSEVFCAHCHRPIHMAPAWHWDKYGNVIKDSSRKLWTGPTGDQRCGKRKNADPTGVLVHEPGTPVEEIYSGLRNMLVELR